MNFGLAYNLLIYEHAWIGLLNLIAGILLIDLCIQFVRKEYAR